MATRSIRTQLTLVAVLCLAACNGSATPSGAPVGPSTAAAPAATRVAPVIPAAPASSPVARPPADESVLDAAITGVEPLPELSHPCPSGWRCDPSLLEGPVQPKVTTVLVEKAAHRLHLAVGDTVVKSYSVALGWGGAGPKQYEGDGRTPVGTYRVTGRLPTSPWHLFLAVSYPNLEDQRRYGALKAKGGVPVGAGVGFGIGIHGRSASMRDGEHKSQDWTLGCIALDNPEIEEVAALVPNGAEVVITD